MKDYWQTSTEKTIAIRRVAILGKVVQWLLKTVMFGFSTNQTLQFSFRYKYYRDQNSRDMISRIFMTCLESNMQLLSQSSSRYSCKNSKRLFYKNFWQWKVWRSPFLSNEKWIRRCIQRRMVYAIDKSLMIGEFQSAFLYLFQTRTTLLWYRT